MQIHHITLSRKQLDSIPETERRLLVLLAHAGNELNVLSKLFHFSAKAKSEVPILQEAENAQSNQRAFEMLVEETSKAVGRINEVIGATMTICFKTYLGGNLYALGAKVIEIQGAPDSQSVSIPYFVEIAEQNDG